MLRALGVLKLAAHADAEDFQNLSKAHATLKARAVDLQTP